MKKFEVVKEVNAQRAQRLTGGHHDADETVVIFVENGEFDEKEAAKQLGAEHGDVDHRHDAVDNDSFVSLKIDSLAALSQ
ncbi:hypothetical protein Cni_G27961 [Canna indica]|uniref:Uncharacterized protein n=1 Tax=Canna indica TaxID=4628 RepID=A0AAQ3L2N8_9LILI|nr:hypothetical protein Cni_G27961 [Canna indica]